MLHNLIMNQFILSHSEKMDLKQIYKQFPLAIVVVKNGEVLLEQRDDSPDGKSVLKTAKIYGASAEILKILVTNGEKTIENIVSMYC